MKDTNGCCGHPQTCANTGRCSAYEEFLEVSQPKSIVDVVRNSMSEEQHQAIREQMRKRKEHKAQRQHRRGDTGRTMER